MTLGSGRGRAATARRQAPSVVAVRNPSVTVASAPTPAAATASPASVARVADPAELEALLDAFAVVVLPDGVGGFVHNAAIYRVDVEGRLVRVYDPDAADRAIADLAG